MIGLLNAYHWDNNPSSYQAKYRPMCIEFLCSTFGVKDVKVYELPKGELPNSPADCKVWFISGSAKSAYEDIDWIHWLNDFIQKSHQQKAKMIGLCFGHQMIAQALGGKVTKSENGWGIGIRSFKVTSKQVWMRPELEEVSLLYSHQDQVAKLPEGAKHLGQSEFCKFEMFEMGEHILAMQGHPEFTKEYALNRYRARVDLIGQDRVEAAETSMARTSSAQQIWQWIKNFATSDERV